MKEITEEQLKEIKKHQDFLFEFYNNTKETYKKIKEVYDEQENNKPQTKLSKLLKHLRRTGMRLDGHEKIAGERRCICGENMNIGASGMWICPIEQRHWNIIFNMLKIK